MLQKDQDKMVYLIHTTAQQKRTRRIEVVFILLFSADVGESRKSPSKVKTRRMWQKQIRLGFLEKCEENHLRTQCKAARQLNYAEVSYTSSILF